DSTPEIAREAGANVVRSERVIGKGGAATQAAREALRHALADGVADARKDHRDAGRESPEEPVFLLCDGDLASSARELGPLVRAVRQGEADVAVAAFAR